MKPLPFSDAPKAVLAVETALGAGAVALWRADAPILVKGEPEGRRLAARLVPMIEELLDEAGLSYADLSGLAVTCGPGGFTGLRIGVATVRSLAFAAALPVYGLRTHSAVLACTAGERESGERAAVTPAGRGQVFVARQGMCDEIGEEAICLLDPADLSDHLPPGKEATVFHAGFTPEGWENVAQTLGREVNMQAVDAAELARVLAEKAAHSWGGAGWSSDRHALMPYYIRPPDAKPAAAFLS